MRSALTVALTALLGYALGSFLPFWSLALAGIAVGGVVAPGGWRALGAGALAGVLLWGGLAYGADVANTGILSARVGALFGTTGMGMVLITAAMGGLLAGLGAALGDRLHKAFNP
jgi:hypothetical protein